MPWRRVTADLVHDYVRQRRRLLARLKQMDERLRAYDEWEANGRLPPDVQRPLPTPPVSRPGLDTLRAKRLAELMALERGY